MLNFSIENIEKRLDDAIKDGGIYPDYEKDFIADKISFTTSGKNAFGSPVSFNKNNEAGIVCNGDYGFNISRTYTPVVIGKKTTLKIKGNYYQPNTSNGCYVNFFINNNKVYSNSGNNNFNFDISVPLDIYNDKSITLKMEAGGNHNTITINLTTIKISNIKQ